MSNHKCPICGLFIQSVRTPGIKDPWGRSPAPRVMVNPCGCIVPQEILKMRTDWDRIIDKSDSQIGVRSGCTIQLERSGEGLAPIAGPFDEVAVYDSTRPPWTEKLRLSLDDIRADWDTYHCSDCGEETRASSRPSYCPVCGTWGVMRDSLDE